MPTNEHVSRSESSRTVFEGSCHCGRITVRLSTSRDDLRLTPRACSCRLCRKHGAAYLSDPDGLIEVMTSGLADDIYQFGYGITDFHICGSCGVIVAATWSDSERGFLGVVNMLALDRADQFPTPVNANFDSEVVSQREARRRLNWTPTVLITGARR